MDSRETMLARLREVLPQLSAEFGVSSLRLFGSFARDEARPDSDVDLVVEFVGRPTLFTLASVRLRLCEALGREVDLGTIGSLRPAVRERAEREWLRVA